MIQVLLHHRWYAHLHKYIRHERYQNYGRPEKSSKKLNPIFMHRSWYYLYPYIYELHLKWSNHNCRKNKAKILLLQSVDQLHVQYSYTHACNCTLYNSAPLNHLLPLSGFLYLALQHLVNLSCSVMFLFDAVYLWPTCPQHCLPCPEAEFLDEIKTRVLRVFLFAIQSHSYALKFLFLQLTQLLTYFFKLTQLLAYFYCSDTVHCKGEKRKTW